MYGYRDTKGVWRDPTESGWTIWGWRAATEHEPGIQPMGDHVVLLQDPYPEVSQGGILLSTDSMEHVGHAATVLALPECAVREHRESGSVVRVIEEGCYRDGKNRLRRMDLSVGDRVFMIRFAGAQTLPDLRNPRLRCVRYPELWAKIPGSTP